MAVILFWGSIGWTVVLSGGTWWLERSAFARKNARERVQVLNGVRLAAAAALLLIVWWAVPQSPLRVLLGVVAGALIFIPEKWLLRIGGIEPKWQLRAIQDVATELARRYVPPRPPEFAQSMKPLVARMEAIRGSEVAEIRDLLIAEFNDWIIGNYHLADLGLRAIRAHQIELELFGSGARRAELDPAEATFRWRLYRTFGDMINCAEREPSHVARLEQLIEEMEQYRRPDTEAFINAVAESAHGWLLSKTVAPWPAQGVASLGPIVARSCLAMWPSEDVFWGAELDDRDISALPTVMEARRIPVA